jgi:predicted nucleotidyltransferase
VNPDWAVSEIDIVIDSPVDYRKAAKDMKNINVNGVLIPTVSMRNLILMKKSAGRIQDKEDIKSLKKVSR